MKLFVVLLVNSLFVMEAYAQIRVIDADDHSPIPNVCFLTSQGKYAGISNMQGIIDLDKTVNAKERLASQHILYCPVAFFIDSIKNSQVILKKRAIMLPEIVVSSPISGDICLAIKGYFRSFQFKNNILKYYADGIVEYYLDKNKVRNRIIQYRYFYNPELTKKVEPFHIEKPKIFIMSVKPVIATLNKEYTIKKQGDRATITKENSVAGYIIHDTNSGTMKFSMDWLAPLSERSFNFLGNIFTMSENRRIDTYTGQDVADIRQINLVNTQGYGKVNYKRKKGNECSEYIMGYEFYTFSTHYLLKSSLKGLKLSSDPNLKEKSVVTSKYWEVLDPKIVPPLPSAIASQLGTTLKQYE